MTAPDAAAGGIGRLGRYLLVGSEKALRIPVGVLISGLASRALGVEDFGLYTSVLVLLTVMAPLASFGLESLGIALASRSRDAATYLRDLGLFRLLTGLAAAALFLVAALAYFAPAPGHPSLLALAAVAVVLVLRVYELAENLLFAQERLLALAGVRIIAFLAANALIAVVLLTRPDLSLLLILSAVEAVLLLVLYLVLCGADVAAATRLPAEGHELGRAYAQCRAAFPVFLSGLLVLVLLNADKLLVFRVLGHSESGLYNAAAKLVDVLYFIPMVIGTTHASSFARLAPGDGLWAAYRSAFRTATLASAAAAIGLAALATVLVPRVYGESFAEAAPVLALLAPCLVAVTWVSLRTRALAALDRRAEILRLTGVAEVIHLPLLGVGLAVGHIEAVAVCQSVGWMLAAAVVPLFSSSARPLSPWHALWVRA